MAWALNALFRAAKILDWCIGCLMRLFGRSAPWMG